MHTFGISSLNSAHLAVALLCIVVSPIAAHAINYNAETNTAYETLEEPFGGTVDLALRFGAVLQEFLKFNRSLDRFEFTNSLHITGNLAATDGLYAETLSLSGAVTALNGIAYTWPAAPAGSAGDVLSVDPADGQLSWTTPGGGGGGNSVVTSSADVVTNSNVADSTVTDLTVPVSADTNYIIRCMLTTSAAGTTTGVRITVNGPDSPNQVTWNRKSCSSATAIVSAQINAFGTRDNRTASAGATRCIETIDIHLRNGSNAGNVTFDVRSEIASSNVTVFEGSSCEYRSY